MKASSKIIKLKPVTKEDEVIPVGGRIFMTLTSTDAMDPMILPKGHHISTIHCCVEQVLSLVREQFWIVKARVTIKKILRRCLHCKNKVPPMMNQ